MKEMGENVTHILRKKWKKYAFARSRQKTTFVLQVILKYGHLGIVFFLEASAIIEYLIPLKN